MYREWKREHSRSATTHTEDCRLGGGEQVASKPASIYHNILKVMIQNL